MTRDISTWVLALGGILFAFGALRVYSVVFADPAARGDIVSADGGVGLIVAVVGLVLLAAGWLMRRSKRTA